MSVKTSWPWLSALAYYEEPSPVIPYKVEVGIDVGQARHINPGRRHYC
jgi:hypothetical protein